MLVYLTTNSFTAPGKLVELKLEVSTEKFSSIHLRITRLMFMKML